MRSGIYRSILTILALVLLASPAFIASAALAQSKDQPVSSGVISTLTYQPETAYWTMQRLNAAKPMPLPQVSKGLTMSAPDAMVLQPTSPMVIANSGGPGDAPQEQRVAGAHSLAEPLFGAYPFSYTRYRLFPDRNDFLIYKTFPYKTTGKLFFTIPGKGNYVCSASSVNSANNSVVWTAGHCVYSPDIHQWHTNFLFVPGRAYGGSPYGSWTVKQAWTLGGWSSNGLLEYDHGALVMNLGGSGVPGKIGQKVGFLGFIANASRLQHWHIHGYPQAARDLGSTPPGAQFDGEHHEICASAWAMDDMPTGTAGADPQTIGVGCDQTGGTSGGPWVVNFGGMAGANNFLNGNNSYRYPGPNPPENLKLFSPYFGDGAVSLRDAAQAVPVP